MPFDPNKPFKTTFEPSQPYRKASPGAAGEVGGALETLYDSVPFLNDARDNVGAYAKTVGDLARGKSSFRQPKTFGEAVERVPEAFTAFGRDLMANRRAGQIRREAPVADFRDRRPRASGFATGVGVALQALPALITGGATAAPTLAASAPRGLMGASARAMKPMADAAVTGGLAAQVTSLGGDGTVAERVRAANDATLPAMALGAGLPVGMAVASKGRRVVTDMALSARRGLSRTVNRAAPRIGLERFLDPRQEAAKRLGEALKADGLGPQEVRAALSAWQTTGASNPAFMDLAGENTRALLRSAASKTGAGRNAAVGYANQVTGDLQGNAISRTRDLTPDRRPVSAVADDLQGQRRLAANEMYPAFSENRVPVTDDLAGATEDTAKWLLGARELAALERKPEVVSEIDAMMGGGDAVDDVSAGTLDYIRRALRDSADEADRGGRGGLARALGDRSREVETSLMDVPGFDDARSTYRGFSQQLDAMDEGGKVLNEVPDDFAATFERLPIEQGGIGARQAIEEAIGRPAEGATGTLNRVATSTNTGRNLETLFGADEAGRYRDAIGREMDRVSNARFISPNTGSQTALREVDDGLMTLPPMSKAGIAKALFDKLRRGVSLTHEERAALVELGTTIVRTGDDIPRIPTTPQAMRLLTAPQRAQLSRALAQFEGSREALTNRQPAE